MPMSRGNEVIDGMRGKKSSLNHPLAFFPLVYHPVLPLTSPTALTPCTFPTSLTLPQLAHFPHCSLFTLRSQACESWSSMQANTPVRL
eukprot:483889-Hanusia_phi.AAC.1